MSGLIVVVADLMDEIVNCSSERSVDEVEKKGSEIAAKIPYKGGRETCQLILKNPDFFNCSNGIFGPRL